MQYVKQELAPLTDGLSKLRQRYGAAAVSMASNAHKDAHSPLAGVLVKKEDLGCLAIELLKS